MECRHPAIVNDKCLVCGAIVSGTAVKPQEETIKEESKQPETAQETPKKATRKRTK